MKFKLPRNRTIASTCGISIEFKKGEFHLVPPAMYAEVIAAGGVSEEEMLDDEPVKTPSAPELAAEREAAIFKAFETTVLKNLPTEFTAGGMPHVGIVSTLTGWPVQAKERDTLWVKFQSREKAD